MLERCTIGNQTGKWGALKPRNALNDVAGKGGKYPWRYREGIAVPDRDRLALAAGSSQIDFPASAPPSASTALSSWAIKPGNVLVTGYFFWCFLLPPLPACFSTKLVFLIHFGSPDHPPRTSPVLLGAASSSLGWQMSLGTSAFGGSQLAASSLLDFQLSAPDAISTPACAESEPGRAKIKPGSIVLL